MFAINIIIGKSFKLKLLYFDILLIIIDIFEKKVFIFIFDIQC